VEKTGKKGHFSGENLLFADQNKKFLRIEKKLLKTKIKV
jgi:hypothetical protein